MRKGLWFVLLMVVAAVPVSAQEKSLRGSAGYAFATYLEEGGGSAPFGLYLSVAQTEKQVGFDVDLGYHRDAEEFFGTSIVLHTIIAGVGPRFTAQAEGAKPYFHVLGGLRYDRIEGESNTAAGGMMGGGVDVPGGPTDYWRLGADFQIFFDEGENLKTLRVLVGLTF